MCEGDDGDGGGGGGEVVGDVDAEEGVVGVPAEPQPRARQDNVTASHDLPARERR